MAVRKRLTHDQKTREKIRTIHLIKRLEKHVLGEKGDNGEVVVLSQSQITAALGLIRKTLPDLSAVEYKGELVVTNAQELSDDQLADIATRGSTGASKEATSKTNVH